MRDAEEGCGTRELLPGRAPQELADGREQLRRLFNIRHVPALIQRHELGVQRLRDGFGAFERDRILAAMDHEGRAAHGREAVREVEVAEARPHGLLNAAGDPERRELRGARRVGEVAGDAQLERPLPVRRRVALLQA